MSMLRISDNKPLEETSLAAHVALASHRYRVLENRVSAIEQELKAIDNQVASNRKFFLKLIGTAAAGLASTAVPLVVYFLNRT